MGSLVPGIIFSSFQGEVRAETQQVVVRPDAATGARPHFDIDRGQLPSVQAGDRAHNFSYVPL